MAKRAIGLISETTTRHVQHPFAVAERPPGNFVFLLLNLGLVPNKSSPAKFTFIISDVLSKLEYFRQSLEKRDVF